MSHSIEQGETSHAADGMADETLTADGMAE